MGASRPCFSSSVRRVISGGSPRRRRVTRAPARTTATCPSRSGSPPGRRRPIRGHPTNARARPGRTSARTSGADSRSGTPTPRTTRDGAPPGGRAPRRRSIDPAHAVDRHLFDEQVFLDQLLVVNGLRGRVLGQCHSQILRNPLRRNTFLCPPEGDLRGSGMPTTKNGAVEIYYDTFGEPSNPTLLLINGLGSQCINYADE